LSQDWFTDLRRAQATAAKAAASLQAEESTTNEAIQELLKQPMKEFDYFKALELQQLLEKSQSPAESEWKQVLDLYRKNNTYMAEAARSLAQLVRYDIPAAKGQAQACRKQVQDGERRQQDLRRREADARKTLRELCDSFQVQGEDPKAELQQLVSGSLPEVLERAAGLVAERCPEPLRFYCGFSRLVLEGDAQPEESVLPMLRLTAAKGNVLLRDVGTVSQSLQADWQKITEEAETQGGLDCVRLLTSSRARGLLVDELHELDAFLAQRSSELEHSSQGELAEELQRSPDEVRQFQAGLAEILEALCGKETQMLLRFHSSEAALGQAASKITTQKALCERPGLEAAALGRRAQQLSAEAELSLGEATRLRERCQQLKSQLEGAISELVKHKVRLVGDVNAV